MQRDIPQSLLLFLDNLNKSATLDEAFEVFQRAIVHLGYDGVNYAFSPLIEPDNPVFKRPVFKTSEAFSTDFMDYYFGADLAQNDYTIRSIIAGHTKTIDWWQDAPRLGISKQEREVMLIAQNYGINNGMTLPLVSNPQFGIAGCSFISGNAHEQFAKLNAIHRDTAVRYSQLFHVHVWTHCASDVLTQFREDRLANLSDTEKRFLRLLAAGLPVKCICDQLGTTTRYGEKLLANLRVKFGHVSRDRLLYYAGLLRIDGLL